MKSTIILSLVAALPMLAQCPCAKPAAPQQCPAMHRPCAQHRPNVEAMKARIMEKFDVNKDGQLDDQEKEAIKKDFEAKANEMKAKFMEKYDTDKDGQLSDEEKAAVKKEFEAKKAEASKKFAHRGHGKCHGKRHGMRHGHHGMRHGMRHGHHGMRHGKPCCGKPACGPRPMMAPAKFAEMKAKFMEKFDANKDGKIDEQEKEAIKKDFEAKANEMKAKFMEKYDTNKDGQLSDEEKAVVKKDFEAKKAEFAKKFAHRGHGKCHGMRHGFRHGKHHGMRHGHHGMRHGKPCCGKPVCGPRPMMQKPCCGKPACGPRPVMVKAVRIQVAPAPQAPTCGIVPGSCGKPAMSKEETEARKAKFMEKFDADKDGQLSDEEKAAAKKFFECRMQVKGHRSHGMRGHRHGKPCFGKPMPGWQPKQPNCSRCRKPAPAPAPAEQPAA